MDKKFETKFDVIDKKFETKLDTIDSKYDKRFNSLDNRLWSHFFWLMGMIIGVAGLIAHSQHWI